MAEVQINFNSLEIAPMTKNMAKGAFSNADEEFKHLADFFKTSAFSASRDKKSKTYVATYEGVLVGYITVCMVLTKDGPDGPSKTPFEYQMVKVGKLFVSPEHRSKGLGSILLKFAISMALRIDELVGCLGVIVDANSNPRTVDFYRKQGFTVIEEPTEDGDTTLMFFRLP